MRYLIRSAKYFVYLLVVLALVIGVLVAAKIVEADLSSMFVNGYDSLWQIALIMAMFAAVYPRFGYASRDVHAPGSDEELLPAVREVMDGRGYRLEEQAPDGTLTFRKRAPFAKAARLWEDRLTFTRIAAGYTVEGRTKDVAPCCSALEFKLNTPSED